jgi:translation initiation factor IF-3
VVVNKAIEYVKDLAIVEAPPKTEGRNMFAMLAPDQTKIKEYLKLHPNKKDEVLEPMKEEELDNDDE